MKTSEVLSFGWPGSFGLELDLVLVLFDGMDPKANTVSSLMANLFDLYGF